MFQKQRINPVKKNQKVILNINHAYSGVFCRQNKESAMCILCTIRGFLWHPTGTAWLSNKLPE